MSLSRRHLLQSASALGAMGLVGCSSETAVKTPVSDAPLSTAAGDKSAQSILDNAKDFMLNAYPETSSSMGIDKGDHAALRAKPVSYTHLTLPTTPYV